MLKCEVLIKLFVLNCVIIYCVHGDTILADGHNKLPKHVEGYAVYSTVNYYN
jgi:hypothetical protein